MSCRALDGEIVASFDARLATFKTAPAVDILRPSFDSTATAFPRPVTNRKRLGELGLMPRCSEFPTVCPAAFLRRRVF